jgi:hypothetical protein
MQTYSGSRLEQCPACTPDRRQDVGRTPQDTFVEILEGGLSVDVVGDDSGPVVTTPVAGSPPCESVKFVRRVASVVPAATTTPIPLVLKIPLDELVSDRPVRSPDVFSEVIVLVPGLVALLS